MGLLDKVASSRYGLGGKTPAIRDAARRDKSIHMPENNNASDPYPDNNSQLDLPGSKPSTTYRKTAPEGVSF